MSRSGQHDGAAPDEPHDLDAERAVVGGVMLVPECFHELDALLDPGEFYAPAHGFVWEAYRACDRAGRGIDIVSVADALRAMDPPRLNTVGGVQYLGALTDTIPTIAHLADHVRIVKRCAGARRGLLELRRAEARLRAGVALGDVAPELEAALARVQGSADAATSATATVRLEQATEEVLHRTYDAVEHPERAVTGRTTSLAALDELTTGWHDGHLWIIAARPGMGKTALVARACVENAARARARDEKRRGVLLASLEMPQREVAIRELARRAGVDGRRLAMARVDERELTRLVAAHEAVRGLPFYVSARNDVTFPQLRAMARRVAASPDGLALVAIDYLQLMRFGGGERFDNREQEVSALSRGLKGLAQELGVPVVAIAQLNRKCEESDDKRPQLHHLRESGAIEQDADGVLMIYRDDYYHKDSPDAGVAEILLAKHRHGPYPETVRVAWRAEATTFEDLVDDERLPPSVATGAAAAPQAYNPYDDDDEPEDRNDVNADADF